MTMKAKMAWTWWSITSRTKGIQCLQEHQYKDCVGAVIVPDEELDLAPSESDEEG